MSIQNISAKVLSPFIYSAAYSISLWITQGTFDPNEVCSLAALLCIVLERSAFDMICGEVIEEHQGGKGTDQFH
jgi:hypothetical protein